MELNNKKILSIFILSSLAISQKYHISHPIVLGLIILVPYLAYSRIVNYNLNRNIAIISGIYSLFLSLAIVAGTQVHYVEMRSKFHENYIDLDGTCILTGIALAFLLYPIIIFVIGLIKKNIIQGTPSKHKPSYKSLLITWLIIFLCWLPYLLTYYPGGIVGDGAYTLEESLKQGMPDHNHWVVFYILILRVFLKLGRLFSTDINVGVFLYTIVESLLFSCVCAIVVYKLRQKIFIKYWWIIVAFYALSGFFAAYSITLWKDAIFSAGIVLISLLLWDLPKDKAPSLGYCLKFALLGFFICFWRNNGVYVLILCIIGLLILLPRNNKRMFVTGTLIIITTIIIQGPVYNALGIRKDSLTESLSVPLQQVAAVVNTGEALTEQQEEIIYSIMPKEKWLENYCPTLSDDIKTSVNVDFLKNHLSQFFEVWAQLLIPNLKIYVKAYLMQTLGFWQLGVYQGNYWDYWVGVQDICNRGWTEMDMFQELTGISVKALLETRMDFISSGTTVWLLLFSIAAILCQNSDRRKRLVVLLPLLSSWIVIMIATPIAYAYRYIVMLPMALPVICLLPFINEAGDIDINGSYNTPRLVNKSSILIKNIAIAVAFFIGLACCLLNVSSTISIIKKYDGGTFIINCMGVDYNANQYIVKGISTNEGEFSWTDGETLVVEVPVKGFYKQLNVEIDVRDTFNGSQSYIVKQDDEILSLGQLCGKGIIKFDAPTQNNMLYFEITLPDASIVNEVYPENGDGRKVSLQLRNIKISEL